MRTCFIFLLDLPFLRKVWRQFGAAGLSAHCILGAQAPIGEGGWRTPFPYLSWPCPYTHKCPELCTCSSGTSPSELLKRTSVLWFWYWPLNSFSQALISWIFSVLSFLQTGLDTWWHFINWHTYCRLYTLKQKSKQNKTKTTTPSTKMIPIKAKYLKITAIDFFLSNFFLEKTNDFVTNTWPLLVTWTVL